MIHNRKKLLALLLSALMITASGSAWAVSNNENHENNNEKYEIVSVSDNEVVVSDEYKKYLEDPDSYTIVPDPVDFVFDTAETVTAAAELSAELPAEYNSETDAGIDSSYFPPVRNQGTEGDCWAFAETAAVEYSMIVRNGSSFKNNSGALSEYHMAASTYKTDNADYKKYTYDRSEGGNRISSSAYLTRDKLNGPVKLSDFGKSAYEKFNTQKETDQAYIDPLLRPSRAAEIEQINFLTSLNSTRQEYFTSQSSSYAGAVTVDGKNYPVFGLNTPVINMIKQAVIEHGGVSSAYYADESNTKYYNSSTAAFCRSWADLFNNNEVTLYSDGTYKIDNPSNHEVVIVGWDDNYSYKNFKYMPQSYDGTTFTPVNGAWIVRNSWGSSFGKDGYEYISYMDPSIGSNATVYDMRDDTSDNIYCYDHLGVNGEMQISTDSYEKYGGPRGVVRFTTQSGGTETLGYIGFFVSDATDSFEFMADSFDGAEAPDLEALTFEDFNNNRFKVIDPETGEATTTVKFSTPGYKTLKLADPIEVTGSFDIYFYSYKPNYVSGDTVSKFSICQEQTSGDYDYFEATDGVSYMANSYSVLTNTATGETKVVGVAGWGDIAQSNNANWCLKAYTDNGGGITTPSPTPIQTEEPTPEPTPEATPASTPEPTPIQTEDPSIPRPFTLESWEGSEVRIIVADDADAGTYLMANLIYNDDGTLSSVSSLCSVEVTEEDRGNVIAINFVEKTEGGSAKLIFWNLETLEPSMAVYYY